MVGFPGLTYSIFFQITSLCGFRLYTFLLEYYLKGRGKTYISRKIARYLRWINYRTRVFSIAKYRLDKLGNRSADFYDPLQKANYQQRVDILVSAVDDALRYLERGGDVVILGYF